MLFFFRALRGGLVCLAFRGREVPLLRVPLEIQCPRDAAAAVVEQFHLLALGLTPLVSNLLWKRMGKPPKTNMCFSWKWGGVPLKKHPFLKVQLLVFSICFLEAISWASMIKDRTWKRMYYHEGVLFSFLKFCFTGFLVRTCWHLGWQCRSWLGAADWLDFISAGGLNCQCFPDNKGWSLTQSYGFFYSHYRDSLLKVGWPSPV